uniref:Uncharacterized protein n=1 Tax=Arundo donax TaxID=35708 RepID=A0A0A8ZS85_ARUDO
MPWSVPSYLCKWSSTYEVHFSVGMSTYIFSQNQNQTSFSHSSNSNSNLNRAIWTS